MPPAMCSAGSSRCSQGLVHTYINTYTGLTFTDPDGLTTSRGPLRYIRACCVELLLNCNGRSFTWQVQWSFYKGDFLGGYVHSRTHEGMRGHGFAPAHQGLLLVGHPKTSRESYRNPYVCTIIIHCKYTQMTNLFCTPKQAKNWYTYIHT